MSSMQANGSSERQSTLTVDFERLGLQEYLGAFKEQGFTDWACICDITESDLAALGVKLGHRRILYREIARQGGFPSSERLEDYQKFKNNGNRPITPVEDQTTQYASGSGSEGLTSPTASSAMMPQKRRYKRHPKPDDNAPVRPPSAYVIFANMTREEQKDANLSFTQLARLVGERWKHLNPKEKEAIEAQAAEVKRRYIAEVTMYKKSPEYEQYQAYLKEFKDRVARDERPEKLEPPRKAQKTNGREHSPGMTQFADHSPYQKPLDNAAYDAHGDKANLPGARITIPSILHEPSRNGSDQSLPPVGYVYNFAGHDHLRPTITNGQHSHDHANGSLGPAMARIPLPDAALHHLHHSHQQPPPPPPHHHHHHHQQQQHQQQHQGPQYR